LTEIKIPAPGEGKYQRGGKGGTDELIAQVHPAAKLDLICLTLMYESWFQTSTQVRKELSNMQKLRF